MGFIGLYKVFISPIILLFMYYMINKGGISMRATMLCKVVFLAISSVLLVGCASEFPDYYGNYNTVVSSWQGASATDLYKKWGYPDETQTLDNGNTLVLYSESWEETEPTTVEHTKSGDKDSGTHSSKEVISSGGTTSYSCKTWFEIDSKKVIVNTSLRGDYCGEHYDAGQSFIDSHSNTPFTSGTCYWYRICK